MPFESRNFTEMNQDAVVELLHHLALHDYDFVTTTPATHEIVVAREKYRQRTSLADVLGWNLPFAPGTIDPKVEDLLTRAGLITNEDGSSRSLVRVSRVGDTLFLHSGFPTSEQDAVFFGPDSYRFADLIARELGGLSLADGALIVDIGTGSGVGAIVAAQLQPRARVLMTDINAGALRTAHANVRAAGLQIQSHLGPELAGISEPIDVALANPPYIIDPTARLYRDGGGELGGDVSLQMARAAVGGLAPGGRLILYTGSAISHGRDQLKLAMSDLAKSVGGTLRYREIDPDVFGEELHGDAYAEVDRIAVIAAVLEMPL